MGLLYFFDKVVKPKMLKGTRMLNPADTGVLENGISCIRQGDVNLWFYTKDGKTLAVDAGHINEKNIDDDFKKINIDPNEIHHVLLTHADVDHCGGIDKNAQKYIYPNAKVYISKKEEQYLNKTLHRMIKFGLKIYNCVRLKEGYITLTDGEALDLDGFKVKCILVPGHTIGHMCYIVDDKILFSGDCLAVNKDGGYAFWDFFCQYPELNKKSLHHLRDEVIKSNIECVCTGHSGYVNNIENLFSHIDESARFKGKIPFDETAPDDVCKR